MNSPFKGIQGSLSSQVFSSDSEPESLNEGKNQNDSENQTFSPLTTTDSTAENDSLENSTSTPLAPSVPIVVGEDEHALQNAWSFWFVRRLQGARTQTDNYEQNIKKVVSFASVEGFWGIYNHMLRPNDLPVSSDYHLFKESIRPLWEDDTNKLGGKWIVRLRKGLASRCWEDLILAVIGEQFEVGDEICGVVISIRFNEDIISVWNKTATDREAKNRIFEKLKAILNIPFITMEYKPHDVSIKDISFRNDPMSREVVREPREIRDTRENRDPRTEYRTDYRGPRSDLRSSDPRRDPRPDLYRSDSREYLNVSGGDVNRGDVNDFKQVGRQASFENRVIPPFRKPIQQ